MPEVAIRVENVSKSFAHVHALRDVSMEVRHGEIVALIGDNGAGKSTLANTIAGNIPPDTGSVYVGGERLTTFSPREVQSLGVETVYQTLALAPDLSIAENLFLGREPVRGPSWFFGAPLARQEMTRRAREALERLSSRPPSIDTLARDLSGGQRQAIAIARAVSWAKNAILLDEPTSALAAAQTAQTNETIKRAAAQGLGIVVITHDLPNMLDYADRILVMRRGAVVAERVPAQTDLSELVGLMVGTGEKR